MFMLSKSNGFAAPASGLLHGSAKHFFFPDFSGRFLARSGYNFPIMGMRTAFFQDLHFASGIAKKSGESRFKMGGFSADEEPKNEV